MILEPRATVLRWIRRRFKGLSTRARVSTTPLRFRPGTYRIGAIFVKSGETLEIPKGVKLLGIQELSAYPLMPTRVAGIEMTWPAALVNVYRQHGRKDHRRGNHRRRRVVLVEELLGSAQAV